MSAAKWFVRTRIARPALPKLQHDTGQGTRQRVEEQTIYPGRRTPMVDTGGPVG